MGNETSNFSNMWNRYWHPDVTPYYNEEPTFDPNYGFSNGRKERVMIATEAEMLSCRIPKDKRDFCAHILIEYQACLADVWPFPSKCSHVKHKYMDCEHEDYILRMKEFEREKRLRERRKRIAIKSGNGELEDS